MLAISFAIFFFAFFFFSSRRRHTRLTCDWSSDVCSSDLGGRFAPLRADEGHSLWMRAAESFATRPVAFRIGGLPDSSDELLDLLQHQVGDEWISASPAIGAIRWGGEATIDRLKRLRRTLAGLEVPLTLERAPWPVRSAVGHFGAYRE